MSTLPQCSRLVTALTDETAFGTAIVDGSLTSMFHLVEPALASLSQDIQDGRDIIKGHEFNDPGTDAWKILFQNVTVPLNNVPMNAEFAAWSWARLLGLVTSAQIGTTVDYTHTCKMMDKCADGDQLPSQTFGLVYSGSSAVNKKYKGGVFSSGSISITDKGRITGNYEIITDGTQSAGSGIAIPGSFTSANFYFGSNGVTLEYDNYGGTFADNSTKLRSFELSVNNNLLVDEAKTSSFATLTTLDELRTGDRDITATLTILADESSQEYIDALAGEKMMVRVTVAGPTLSGGNDADLVILIPEARWKIGSPSYDGTRRVLAIEHDFYWNAAEDSPIVVTVTNNLTAVL